MRNEDMENNRNNNMQGQTDMSPNFIMTGAGTGNIDNNSEVYEEVVEETANVNAEVDPNIYQSQASETNFQGTQQQEAFDREYVSYDEGTYMKNDSYEPASYQTAFQQNGNAYTVNEPVRPTKTGNKKNRNHSFGKKAGKFVACAVCFGLIAGGVMTGMQYGAGKLLGSKDGGKTAEVSSTSTVNTTSKGTISSGNDVSSVVENVMPSIVSITSKVATTNDYGWFFGGQTQESTSAGSGIIIGKNDKELLVVTNNHVIKDAKEMQVGFCDSENVNAEVKGTDPSSDLAVVAVKLSDVKESTLNEIKIAVLGDSKNVKVGDSVIAIGNALGYGQSVTTGVVSALDREVTTTDYSMKLLQTDAAINPGNSGGALLNMNGEVIGINSVKYSDSDVEGMGYAIPVSLASPIINDLMNEEVIPESEQAYLGIVGSDINSELVKMYSMPEGVWISEVENGSPAQQSGLQQRDIITEFDGKQITSMKSLQEYLSKHRAGENIKIKVKRQRSDGEYKEETVTVTLGNKSSKSN